MKLKDIMQTSVISVPSYTPVKEVGRIIFSLGITGIPVTEGKKLLGMITEQDLLSHVYPKGKEEKSSRKQFEDMEGNLARVLNEPVSKVMNTNPTTIGPDVPILEAQLLMLIHQFSQLPVVDTKNNVIGMVSQADIFNYLLLEENPHLEREQYADFVAKYYDTIIDWEQRTENELPGILRIFEREKVKTVLDIGSWTGEYGFALARQGYEITCLDHNPLMIELSQKKKKSLPKNLQDKIQFGLTDFSNLNSIAQKFDAIICMGNALSFIPEKPENVLTSAFKLLKPNGVAIFQILNTEKALNKKHGFMSFRKKLATKSEPSRIFTEFLDREENGKLSLYVASKFKDREHWVSQQITHVPLWELPYKKIEKMLAKAGFVDCSFSGNRRASDEEYGKLSFIKPFEPETSDWMNVVARKK